MKLNPHTPTEGVTYALTCDNCGKDDAGATSEELEIAMANHICEDAE